MARHVTPRRIRRWLLARDGFTDLLGLSQRDHDSLASQAYRRLDRGAIDEALALYQAILTLWPKDLTARLGVGACLQSKGDLTGAEASYSEVLDIEPTNLFALVDRAEVRLLMDQSIEARSDLELASALPDRQIRLAGLRDRLYRLQEFARKPEVG